MLGRKWDWFPVLLCGVAIVAVPVVMFAFSMWGGK